MLTKVHHVTYVVESVQQMAAYLKDNFDMTPERTEDQPKLGYKSLLYRIGETLVDFFEPLRDARGEALVQRPPATGFVRMLKESGPGIWHIGWGVNGIEQAFETLKKKGNKFHGSPPTDGGTFGYKTFSIDPSCSQGVFFHLAEGDSVAIVEGKGVHDPR